jgi:hypothetical protein
MEASQILKSIFKKNSVNKDELNLILALTEEEQVKVIT